MPKDICVICLDAISHPDLGGIDRSLCPRDYPVAKCAYPMHFKCMAELLREAGDRDLSCLVCREACDMDNANFVATVGMSRVTKHRVLHGERRNASQRRRKAEKKALAIHAPINQDVPEMG